MSVCASEAHTRERRATGPQGPAHDDRGTSRTRHSNPRPTPHGDRGGCELNGPAWTRPGASRTANQGRTLGRGRPCRPRPSPHRKRRGARSSATTGQRAPTARAGQTTRTRQATPRRTWPHGETCEVRRVQRGTTPRIRGNPHPVRARKGRTPSLVGLGSAWGWPAWCAAQREGSRLPAARESRSATSRASAAQTPVAPQCRGKAGCHASGADRPMSSGPSCAPPPGAPFFMILLPERASVARSDPRARPRVRPHPLDGCEQQGART